MRWIGLPCVLLLGCSFSAPNGGLGTDAGRDDGGGPTDADTDGPSVDGPPSSPAALKRQLEVVGARVAGGPHTSFPLLVAITGNWLRTTSAGGDVRNTNGFDIGFFADEAGTMRLAHEVELYDGTTGALVAWVKVPSLTAMSTLFVHYGDPALMTSQQDIPGVWSGFSGVWHLGGFADSASTNNGNDSGSTAATGRIGNARGFDGSNDFIDVGSGSSIDDIFNGGGTVEAWINPAGWGGDNLGRILEKSIPNGGRQGGWSLAVDNSNITSSLMFAYGATSGFNPLGLWNAPASSVALNAWTHVAVVYDRGSVTNNPSIFVNGTPMTATRRSAPGGSMTSDATYNGRIGNRAGSDRTFNGMLDEVRMHSGSRSADWILTSFRNQSDPVGFLTVSAQL